MSSTNINYYIAIPKGSKMVSAKGLFKACLPKNLKLNYRAEGDDNNWDSAYIELIINRLMNVTFEKIPLDDKRVKDMYAICGIENRINTMTQIRAKSWVKEQLERTDYFVKVTLAKNHTNPFWKMTEKIMDYICKNMGAELLISEIGFLNNRGSYITIENSWLSSEPLLNVATLDDEGKWIDFKYSTSSKSDFLKEDFSDTIYMQDNVKKMTIYLY